MVKASFISIIILLYKESKKFALECLDSIFKHSDYPFEICFIDNGLTDDTVETVLKRYRPFPNRLCKRFYFLKNDKNLGWAGGNNVGILNTKGDFICLLNVDTRVEEKWLTRLLEPFRKDSTIGGVNPYCNNTGCKEARCKERPKEMGIVSTKGIYGSCMFFARKVIDKVGLFDENFNDAHGEEDRDFSLRMTKAGFKFAVAPTFVFHYGKGTLNQLSSKEIEQRVLTGRKVFEQKWHK